MTDALTPEAVRLAYRLILGREPESEAVIRWALGHGTLDRLRAAFLASDEFNRLMRLRHQHAPPSASVPLDAGPIEVETTVSSEIAATLLSHVGQTWTRLGYEQPHWSVLSAEQFRPEAIGEHEDAFYESGTADTDLLMAVLYRHGFTPASLPRVLEYGCGLGRVTAHLARAFRSVTACDISRSHLQQAEQILARACARNVIFRLVGLPDFGMQDHFDLWFSRIVLQHNPPPIISMILQRAFTQLAPGGVAVFQVPTYAIGYRFVVSEYLRGTGRHDNIEMHVLPQRTVLELAWQTGCVPLEIREDTSTGHTQSWLSNIFVLHKPR